MLRVDTSDVKRVGTWRGQGVNQIQKRDSESVATRSRRIARTAAAAAFVLAFGGSAWAWHHARLTR